MKMLKCIPNLMMICKVSQIQRKRAALDRRSDLNSQQKVNVEIIETSEKFFKKIPYSKELEKLVKNLQIQSNENSVENFLENSVECGIFSQNESIKSLMRNSIDRDKIPQN